MLEKIFDALCAAVSEEFELPVYTDRAVQNVNSPCFVIRVKKSETELFFGKKYIMRNEFCVMLLDDGRKEHEYLTQAVERLCGVVKLLDYGGGKVHGSGIRCELNENRLELYVNYDFFVYKYSEGGEETGLMQEYELETDI
ncbi:MAG: hypothetical protein IJR45_01990 [Firmicutes bacterium]|nr:hypothetical protein [Bacillota bacterium]MBQ9604161.1 hypothetical protein [Bacillota bacterium]